MEVEDDAVEPAEAGIAGEHGDVVHGPRIALDGLASGLAGSRVGGAAHEREGFLVAHVEALDARRLGDRRRPHESPQRAHPRSGPVRLAVQSCAQLVELAQVARERARDLRRPEEHRIQVRG